MGEILSKYVHRHKLKTHNRGIQWDEEYLDKSGSIMPVGSAVLRDRYGIESWVQYTGSELAWGELDDSGIILTHRGSNPRYGYTVQLMNSVRGSFQSLYALDFSAEPPAGASIIKSTPFMREPRPAGYWGTSESNKKVASYFLEAKPREAFLKNLSAEAAKSLCKKKSDNTSLSYAALDQFVQEQGGESLALAAYVQNEIELVDGLGIPEKAEAEPTIHSGKVSRSPLTAPEKSRKLSAAATIG